jgi:hypothetical protein
MKTALVTASLALLFDVAAAGQQQQRFSEGLRTAKLISDVLASAGVSGSLEYNGKCGPGVLVPDLPPIREPQKPYAQNAANTLRSMFSVDGRMVVTQEGNGTIRVVEAGVPTDILDVRISHLSFDRISDPEQALSMVLGAPEVQSFIQSHDIGQPFNIYAAPLYALPGLQGLNKSPTPGVRSISGELKGVTLADALDYIMKTFPGFWLYQNCESFEGQRVVHFGLFPVPGKMWMWENDQTLVR